MTNNHIESLEVARTADIGTPVIIGDNSHGVIVDRDDMGNVTVSWTVSVTTTTVPAKTWADMGMTVDEAFVDVAESAARAMIAQGGSEAQALEFGANQAMAYYRALQRPTRRVGRVG